MSGEATPFLRFELVDPAGVVYLDETVNVLDLHAPGAVEAMAERHARHAEDLAGRGIRVEMRVTDPDGVIPTHHIPGPAS